MLDELNISVWHGDLHGDVCYGYDIFAKISDYPYAIQTSRIVRGASEAASHCLYLREARFYGEFFYIANPSIYLLSYMGVFLLSFV